MAVTLKPKGTITRYGRDWQPGMPDWAIELWCYSRHEIAPAPLEKRQHFINASNMFWGHPKAATKFIWHPWAEDMLDACLEHNLVGLAGSASSGKSRYLAVWLLLNWMSDPARTLALATSTTIRDAKKRVWGAVTDYWSPISNIGIGKLVNSPTPGIKTVVNGRVTESSGVYLIPAEAKKTVEVTSKMRGMKAMRIFLGADELSELGHALVQTALTNLRGGVAVPPGAKPGSKAIFHMTAAANPSSYYDPFGDFVEPVGGWQSVSCEDTEWETKYGGKCLHFDALKNPNYLARRNMWPIQKWESIVEAEDTFDANSPEFWRDFRAFWCPTGSSAFVYSEADIINHKGNEPVLWQGKRTRVAGFDVAFTANGDRAPLVFGWHGLNVDGVEVICFDKAVMIVENLSDKDTPRTDQIAAKVAEECKKEGVLPRFLGVDSTSGGGAFCDTLVRYMRSNEFLRVNFGAAASDRPVSPFDETPSNEKYSNRVSELWFYGLELLRSGQLRGVFPELVRELTARKYDTRRSGSTKLRVEPKVEMKARTGKSPDIADAAVVMLEVCRERVGMKSGLGRTLKGSGSGAGSWKRAAGKFAMTAMADRSLTMSTVSALLTPLGLVVMSG